MEISQACAAHQRHGPEECRSHGVLSIPKKQRGNSDSIEKRPSNSDFKDDPLISRPIESLTLLQELLIPSSGRKVRLRALLDFGCTKCLISPTMVGKLVVHLKRPKNPITFCQLDGSIAGGIPAMFGASHGKPHQDFNFFHGTRDGMPPHLRADMVKSDGTHA